MASIRKRGGRWQVQIRRKGQPARSNSFSSLKSARQWVNEQERLADLGKLERPLCPDRTISHLLDEYQRRVSPQKRGADKEIYLVERLKRGLLGGHRLANLSPAPFADYRDSRLKSVKPATVRREFSVLHHAFELARDEWGWEIPQNPLQKVRLPKASNARNRRLDPGEEERLLGACAKARTPWLKPAVDLAIATAMRRGELLNARYEHIEDGLLLIPQTKTGAPRTIPLTPSAQRVITVLPHSITGYLIPTSANALRLAWERAKRRADIDNLHFHDLRHEAISRFFEMGLTIPEVALISGHKDYRMLARYTHLRPETLLSKLNPLESIVTRIQPESKERVHGPQKACTEEKR